MISRDTQQGSVLMVYELTAQTSLLWLGGGTHAATEHTAEAHFSQRH